MEANNRLSRRTILQAVGASAPTLQTVGGAASQGCGDGAKFTPIELSQYFNTSSAAFGPRQSARRSADGLIHSLGGKRDIRGIPFLLGPEDVQQKSWIALSRAALPWAVPKVEIPINRTATCL
jgi:hypothetical protein